jgi:hypothetical protein
VAEAFRLVLQKGESVEICIKRDEKIMVEPYSSVQQQNDGGTLVRDGVLQEQSGHFSVTRLFGPATISIVRR